MSFSLKMVVLLHKWEFKNTEVEFLKVSEKIWPPGLPDIGARKSWDFLILTVNASTDLCATAIIMVLLRVEYTASIEKNGRQARLCIDPNTYAGGRV